MTLSRVLDRCKVISPCLRQQRQQNSAYVIIPDVPIGSSGRRSQKWQARGPVGTPRINHPCRACLKNCQLGGPFRTFRGHRDSFATVLCLPPLKAAELQRNQKQVFAAFYLTRRRNERRTPNPNRKREFVCMSCPLRLSLFPASLYITRTTVLLLVVPLDRKKQATF